jgi:adenylate cyclase
MRLHLAVRTFNGAAYGSVFATCWDVGTDSASQFFFLVGACLAVLMLGIEHIMLASVLAGIDTGLIIALEFLVPVRAPEERVVLQERGRIEVKGMMAHVVPHRPQGGRCLE